MKSFSKKSQQSAWKQKLASIKKNNYINAIFDGKGWSLSRNQLAHCPQFLSSFTTNNEECKIFTSFSLKKMRYSK